ncbi:septum formation initiator family protein [Streptomyces sp. A7024]|uniref:Septum formation initiator family protein n=1 Tax=Streptomyces coryli TaxID=1128680 RepID=A0A6G4U3D5_9ACTN|nr:septum formation initiator family protein [Streptomyces coryli]NGN66260.1 septum formation initiator family protein [Streptomyces coryli]
MPAKERFSTTTRLKLLGEQAVLRVSERVYRARPPRRSRLTGRAAVLALVVCSLVVALAYPMRQYITQRADIAEQQQKLDDTKDRLEKLRDEKARWQDPDYARRQIRERLHYVNPGEKGYIVRGSAGDGRRGADPSAADRPWYENLLDGIDAADAASATR